MTAVLPRSWIDGPDPVERNRNHRPPPVPMAISCDLAGAPGAALPIREAAPGSRISGGWLPSTSLAREHNQ